MRFALISVATNIVLGVAFFTVLHRTGHGPSQGIEGIAAATSVAAWLNVAQMTRALWVRGWYRPSAPAVRRLVRIALCAVLMGGALAALSWARPWLQALTFGKKELAVGVAVIAGGALYVLLLPLFRAVTPSEIRNALKRPPKAAGVADAPSEF